MRRPVFVSAVFLVLMGAIGLAQSISYDYDKASDFSSFKNFPPAK